MACKPDEEWDDRLEALERSATQHQWMDEPRYKRLFRDIEDRISGVLGAGEYEWADRRVFDSVFDQSTLLALHKLMQGGEIETLDFPIARGKEAHVFHATTGNGPAAVKIFHTANAVFKSLSKYIDGAPRANRRNVLGMDLVGHENSPAPRLKDVSVDNVQDIFEKLLNYIAVMWQYATLVHSDFSEFNVLWHEDTPWIIDVGQAVVEQHPSSKEFLVRDVTRTVEWANRNGMDVDTAESLLRVIEDPAPKLEPLPGLD